MIRSPSPGGIRSHLGSDAGAASPIIVYSIQWVKRERLARCLKSCTVFPSSSQGPMSVKLNMMFGFSSL